MPCGYTGHCLHGRISIGSHAKAGFPALNHSGERKRQYLTSGGGPMDCKSIIDLAAMQVHRIDRSSFGFGNERGLNRGSPTQSAKGST